MIEKETLVKIGQFVKSHGTKGELLLHTHAALPDNEAQACIFCEVEGIMVPFFITSHRRKGDAAWLVTLETIDSEEAARTLAHLDVYLEGYAEQDGDLLQDNAGENFVGYLVTDQKYGPLGPIVGVDRSTPNVLFEIEYKEKELLVPAIEQFIRQTDPKKRQLTVDLPQGLLDL